MSMDSTYEGKTLSLKIYGQSHSETIGVYIKAERTRGLLRAKKQTR